MDMPRTRALERAVDVSFVNTQAKQCFTGVYSGEFGRTEGGRLGGGVMGRGRGEVSCPEWIHCKKL